MSGSEVSSSGEEEEGASQQPPSKKQKKGRGPSDVWGHVEVISREDGKRRVRCKYCQVERSKGAPERVMEHLATKCASVSTCMIKRF
jgi:hypothetical protein